MTHWTKESEWRSWHGIATKLKDLDDTYLANLYQYAQKYLMRSNVFVQLVAVLKEIQKERGLEDDFMERAQIPYKNPNGKWEIWDFEEHCLIELD